MFQSSEFKDAGSSAIELKTAGFVCSAAPFHYARCYNPAKEARDHRLRIESKNRRRRKCDGPRLIIQMKQNTKPSQLRPHAELEPSARREEAVAEFLSRNCRADDE